jgi:hypothetical protein
MNVIQNQRGESLTKPDKCCMLDTIIIMAQVA